MTNKIRVAIVPVGGLGTRFLPATKAMPKEMLPVHAKPLIQHVFDEARSAGIEKFIFIIGRNKHVVANHFDHSYELESELEKAENSAALAKTMSWLPKAGSIAFVRQQKTLGLGHAVLCAQAYINEPFAVLLPDELFCGNKNATKELIKAYNKLGGNVIAVQKTPMEKISSYGIIAPNPTPHISDDDITLVDRLIEKPDMDKAPSDLAIVGRYILQPEIFKYLRKIKVDRRGEIQLTDAIDTMNRDHQVNTYAKTLDIKRFDCGSVVGFLKANIHFALGDDNIKDEILNFIKEYST